MSSGEATDSAATTWQQSQTPLPSDPLFSPWTAKRPLRLKPWSTLDAEAKVGGLKVTWMTAAWNGRVCCKPRLKGTPHPRVMPCERGVFLLLFPGRCFSPSLWKDLVQSPASHLEETISYSLKVVIPKLS